MFVIDLIGFERSSRRNNCQVPTMALYVAKFSLSSRAAKRPSEWVYVDEGYRELYWDNSVEYLGQKNVQSRPVEGNKHTAYVSPV